MSLLDQKTGLVFGIANERSIAWAIAQAAAKHGARLGISYQGERLEKRVRPLAATLGADLCMPCDVQDTDALDAYFEAVRSTFGRLDFLVHSIAYAPREDLMGRFVDTTASGFQTAMAVSAFSLTRLAAYARPLMKEGGSIISLTYVGGERVIPNYNVMGPAKAALEASVKYLASDLGPEDIRVNGISAGPIRTLAASGIPGFRSMLAETAKRTPLRRNITFDEIANAAVFLLSDMSSGVTGEIMHVDAGYHIMGAPPHEHE
jgi:enoyl-[acyl-carrier protein] reductase I